MSDENTTSIRICQEGHANALALNKDCTQIAVAGRSRKYFIQLLFFFLFSHYLIKPIECFSIKSIFHRE